MTDTITFDAFTPAHLDGALRLSREAVWPHRREDWHLLLRLGRGVVALSRGAVVGTALATRFGAVAMANMIIVDARMRGRGLGRQLLTRAMDWVDLPEWRLTATKDGLPLFEKLGFIATDRVLQHQGLPVAQVLSGGVDWASAADRPAIQALDRQATGANRAALITILMHEGRMALVRKGAGVVGYACLRRFGRGEVVGPVVAETVETAHLLLGFLFAQAPRGFLRVDTTESAGLAPWLTAQGLRPVGGGISMQRGGTTTLANPVRRFALAAQALG